MNTTTLINILLKYTNQFHPIIPAVLQYSKAYYFDLSAASSEFIDIHPNNLQAFTERTKNILEKHHTKIAIGRYAEVRPVSLYDRNMPLSRKNTCIHLGIDLTVDADTFIFAPLDAIVHSFKNNDKGVIIHQQ